MSEQEKTERTEAFPLREDAESVCPKTAFPLGAYEDSIEHEGLYSAAAEFLAKLRPNSDLAGMNQLQFFLICVAGWINRNQQNAIEYLQEEVKVLKEQLGKKPRFNDDQRRRLAVKAKKLGLIFPHRGLVIERHDQ